ncbi:hypothetical protein N1031_19705 [Herbiconiux moechotypicola]|uniref:Uncharacterized protein n=1 Tax=Herbiconiux moechotypicola TaxID=637393 RepID=A0ABN3E661_9MICO|nr:hypothetical protein [Herbiconiux moechotypicola]MCS5731987.1 hypothetical protein [Herbiconiux moechotypicola]
MDELNQTPVSPVTDSPVTAEKHTLTRRQVAVGAAWAAPVIALAVATPLAAASTGPVSEPAAAISGALNASFAGGVRTVNYSAGAVTYDPDGSGLTTGNITVALSLFGDSPNFPLTVDNASWTSLGWTRLSDRNGTARFQHAAISSGTIPTGTASWSGADSDYVSVAVNLAVAQAGIGAVGLTYTFDPDEG